MLFATLATALLLAPAGIPLAASSVEQCPVAILILGRTPGHAFGISAALSTRGPMKVVIPKYEKVGFRVVRVSPTEPDSIPPELVDVPFRKIKRPSLGYDFEHPVRLRVWWTDVAPIEPGSSEGFTVRPGRYRFSVVFSLSDPTEDKAETVRLCKVYSDAFVVSESTHFLQLP